MDTELLVKDNVPFWPHKEGGSFFVTEGLVNIFHSKMDADGEPVGPRTFLFQMMEGELFIALSPHTRGDGTVTGLLAIPAMDCELNKASPSLTGPMRVFVEEFVEKCGRRLGHFREKIENDCKNLDETGIEAFIEGCMRLIDGRVEEETRKTRDINKRRYAGEISFFNRALDTLLSVVPGAKTGGDPSSGSVSNDALIAACDAVAVANGMKITVPGSVQGDCGPHSKIIEDIAAASHFRTREVILADKWYRQNGGSFVTKLKDTGEPVALIQKTPRKYMLFNPATGENIKVTRKVADMVDPKAVMFYRNLPTRAITGKDVFRFVMQGTGRRDWIVVFLMGLCGGLLGMLSPEISGRVFDTIIPEGDKNMLVQIGFLMGAAALTTFVFELTRSISMQRISGAAERDLQPAVWDRLLSLPVGFFKNFSAGELTQRAMSISQIQQIVTGTVANTIITSIFSVFYLVVMFTKSTTLSWIGLGVVLLTVLLTLGFGWLQLRHESKQLTVDNKITGRMFGWLSGLSKIKMSGSEKRTFYNWSRMFKESRAITFRKESLGNWLGVFNSLISPLMSVLLFAAMVGLKENRLSVGAFIAFNAALGSLLGNAVQLSGAVMSANVIGPLYKQAKPIFDASPEYDEQKLEAPPLTGDIELSRVSFSYIKDGPQVIKDVSLRIRSGEHVALVGPSGSGKSTLFRILLAFEQPESGEIYFDGIGLDQLDIRSVRRQLGVVLQSGQLQAGSIFENIAGANPNITIDDAMEAVRQAGMEEDLKQMPMGLHTMVSEGLGTLSGGQRQRLMIARALAGKPRILFFDEATSALDNKTQKIVSDSVNALKTTRITIAHRLSTIMECDRIIVLEAGRITEEGTYDELMKQSGTFAEMARRQLA